MRPFSYAHATDLTDALQRILPTAANEKADSGGSAYLAGGTTLLDLMKLGTISPAMLVDIKGLASDHARIQLTEDKLRLGALATMATVADTPDVQRAFPVIAQSLALAASPQIRNMATLGGNVLQRPRCNYFRDPSWPACNKRLPGSGCGAMTGVNRKHAILGVSDACIATYPGDFAQALIALDASVEIIGKAGRRDLPFDKLHVIPGTTADKETHLEFGDIIIGFSVPRRDWMRRSLYLKIRDRQSYEFALASAAVALDIHDGKIREARIALGGVATIPWRAYAAEKALIGKELDKMTASLAAAIAFSEAITHGGNDYKKSLGQKTLTRALLQARDMEI